MTRIFLSAEWRSLVMLNYRVPPSLLEPHVPRGTKLDLFGGAAYVSVVGFLFCNTKLLGIPIPGHTDFEEINLRFYVRREVGSEVRHGVTFLRELVPKRAITIVARLAYNEPYRTVRMQHSVDSTRVSYGWKTRHSAAWNRLSLDRLGEGSDATPGSEEAFITQHFWGYTRTRSGSTIEYQVQHPNWRVWRTSHARLEGDPTDVFGAQFAPILTTPPHSAMFCDGSPVTVHRPTKFPQ